MKANITKIDLAKLSSAQGFKITAPHRGLEKVRSADINGDGIDDLIFSDSGTQNVITILYGKEGGYSNISLDSVNSSLSNGYKITDGGESIQMFSPAIGDVNGDGISDIIIGRYMDYFGDVKVVYSKKGGFKQDISLLDSNNPYISTISKGDSNPGLSVGSGDINGDRIDDIIIGEPAYRVNGAAAGAVHVIYGYKHILANIDLNHLGGKGFTIVGIGGGHLGDVLASGDVNGDCIDDIIIGASWFSNSTYIIYGQPGKLSNINLTNLEVSKGIKILGTNDGFFTTFSTSDINGDKVDDIILITPVSHTNSEVYSKAFVIYGKHGNYLDNIDLTKLTVDQGFTIKSPDRDTWFIEEGWSTGSADINNDCIGDIILGSKQEPAYDTVADAKLFIIYGMQDKRDNIDLADLSTTDGILLVSNNGYPGEQITLGSTVAVGDINGDKIDDIVAVREASGNKEAYVVYDIVSNGQSNCSFQDCIPNLNFNFNTDSPLNNIILGSTVGGVLLGGLIFGAGYLGYKYCYQANNEVVKYEDVPEELVANEETISNVSHDL